MENLRNVTIKATIETNKDDYDYSGDLNCTESIVELLGELVDFINANTDSNFVLYEL
jgi:predicted HTH transcriptional regulator